MSESLQDKRKRKQQMRVPLLALVFFGSILLFFRAVLLPFILALVIVYLMEPLVNRLSRLRIGQRTMPRWGAVVTVFISFFTTVILFGMIFFPPLAIELTKAAEDVPAYFQDLRENQLPELSQRLEKALGLYFKEGAEEDRKRRLREAIGTAETRVSEALDRADRVQQIDELPLVDVSGAQPLLLVDTERDTSRPRSRRPGAGGALGWLVGEAETFDRSRVAFTLVSDPDSEGFALLFGDANLHLRPDGNGGFLVQFEPAGQVEPKDESFSLERELNKALDSMLASGGEYAGDALELAQTVLAETINAFVKIILMFMVAAFISIDLDRILRFFRSLFPKNWHEGYDDLLSRFDRGLSGVIRGQLVICAFNGTLTGIGLYLLDVKFALMLGILGGVLSIIPIFGTIISTIPAVLVGLMNSGGTALAVLLLILGVHFIEANFLSPKIIGHSANLHPVTVIFALLAGESAFGVFGALLAVPVASIVQTIFLFIRDHMDKEAGNLPSPEEPLPPPPPDPFVLPAPDEPA